ncbi:hypothetical protein [Mucilaginibacter flavus]|uniref:hypothetical protein n=1 Tax=Mucilaginibacter flavus TaxID=931504 RepID=UPI0025B2AEF1|nr:hypothetical protein [Mucilaginibacter flavus]MDN3580366.1 hypothetical protein [Mucilaginibacter flavus]
MARAIITYNEFKDILGEQVLTAYSDCIRKGFDDQLELLKFNASLDCFVELDSTTKAKFTHNRICGRLQETFKGNSSISVDTIRQIIMVNISDKVLIRQKKFRSYGNISSYSTKQHKKFLKQSSIEGFPEEPTFIVGGYMMDKTNTGMLGVYFACYSANGIEWFTRLGEYVHEQQRIDFNPVVTRKTEEAYKPLKTKLTKMKVVHNQNSSNTQNGTLK